MHERATSQKEMAQIVANNQQLLKQSSQNKHVVYDSHRNDTKRIDYSVQLTEQIARIEASKQSQMTLLQEQVISAWWLPHQNNDVLLVHQCDQLVNSKKIEAKTLQSQIRQLETTHSSELEVSFVCVTHDFWDTDVCVDDSDRL